MSEANTHDQAEVIKIVMSEVTGLLATIVRDPILWQPDMTIVKEIARAEDADLQIAAAAADVVVTSLQNTRMPTIYQELLFTFPHLALVAISADRHHVAAYKQKIVHEFGREQLVEVIRDVARSRKFSQP
jgi:DNA-binding NarL/FixJ family response regulator